MNNFTINYTNFRKFTQAIFIDFFFLKTIKQEIGTEGLSFESNIQIKKFL